MKKLLIVSAFALLAVVGVALYATKVLTDFHQRDQKLRADFRARAAGLRETDAQFPWEPKAGLDPVRFPVYLEVRREIGDEFAARIAEHSRGAFHARETHNELLGRLREVLLEKKMGLAEYRATAARWRALLARGEPRGLVEAWGRTVTTPKHPEGLPLPPPAADATEKETGLLARYERTLEETMHADLLDPLLDEVAKG